MLKCEYYKKSKNKRIVLVTVLQREPMVGVNRLKHIKNPLLLLFAKNETELC